jgi:predicted MPP superfamily phosphohydrolase
MRGLDLMTELRHRESKSYRILLFHYPDFAQLAAQAHVDLYLAGHTHGGQVRVPFYGALLVNSLVSGEYQMGRYDIEDTTLFVSRGVGFSGGYEPQVRFRCPPEVVLITLRGKLQG